MTVVLEPTEQLVADDLLRQVEHWLGAARTFVDAEEFASAAAWGAVERQVGVPLRRRLADTVRELVELGRRTVGLVRQAALDPALLPPAHHAVQHFRRQYVAVETTLDFFGDAVSSRTGPALRAALSTLDGLAVASMRPVLDRAGIPVPPVLTYLDRGLGASILRAGIRLWSPGTLNPVAAIKVVRHNLYRPTSLFHECGHQVAHLTRWTGPMGESVAAALGEDMEVRAMWRHWASEITADVFAFLHTGFASVAALYDVVGDSRTILRWSLGDPHPVGWLRTLLGCAFCRACFGAGPWDGMERAVTAAHPLQGAAPVVARLLERSLARVPLVAEACLSAPVPALHGMPMAGVVDPGRVSPDALGELERTAGAALWRSPYWRHAEGVRTVALTGLREAEDPGSAPEWIERARRWMTAATPAA